jgi:amino acid adenylation domain-containing protein
MRVKKLLRYLAEQDVELQVIENSLRISSPEGVITDEIKRELSEQKQEIISHLSNDQTATLQSIQPTDSNVADMSFSQQRLWFINELNDQSSSNYNIVSAFEIGGRLFINALIDAVKHVFNRHESLRTRFVLINGRTYQQIDNELELNIPIIDIEKADVEQCLSQQNSYAFNLIKGPLINVQFLRVSSTAHILLINMHHIISDGHSLCIFLNEISSLYRASIQGLEFSLPPLAIQFKDFAHWQRNILKGPVLEKQLDYWKAQLADSPALLQLPLDRPRAATQSNAGDSIEFTLSTHQANELRALSQNNQSTLFMTLMAAFKLIVAQSCNQDDINIGTPVTNRQRPELENLIGFFVNTVVIRSKVDYQISFLDFLSQVRETTLAAFSHQEVPFDRIVEELNPKRSQSYSPLFQVMFSLHSSETNAFTLADVDITTLEIETTTTQFDLSLNIVESANKITGFAQYNTDLFDRATIDHLLERYQRLIENISKDPDLSLNKLVSAGDLNFVNTSTKTLHYPSDLFPTHGIVSLFERQANENPFSVAAVYENEAINYGDLNSRSNQLAHYLVDMGVGPDITVALCMDNCLELMISLIAVLKAGGAYVPVAPTFPERRMCFIIRDSKCICLLTQEKLHKSKFADVGITKICVDRDWESISRRSVDNPITEAVLDNLAYIIYTSGSTGQPKGVMATHRAFRNHVDWMTREFNINSNDKFLHKTPLIFDVACSEWAMPLLTGAQLVIPTTSAHRDAEEILALIKFHKITVLHAVPSLINHLLHSKNCNNMRSLRYVFSAGEPLLCEIYNKFVEQGFGTILCNLYGTTETTIDSTCWMGSKRKIQSSVPVGNPIDNTQIYVLDENYNPVPSGVKGELYVAGTGLARGYANNAKLTAENFIPNMFCNQTGTRLYRTGDFGRLLHDGTIEVAGRLDHQVKIRGLRIELGEIEQVLLQHPAVKEAAIVAYQNNNQSTHNLIAFIVVSDQDKTLHKMLFNYLFGALPNYMVPTSLLFLDALPLTTTGKVDRKNLLSRANHHSSKESLLIPSNITEKKIAAIWAETLNIEEKIIATDISFFDLGGHSLLATQMINRLNVIFKNPITIRDLFTYPTIAQLASAIESNKFDTITTHDEIEHIDNRVQIPLSLPQRRFSPTNNKRSQLTTTNNIPTAVFLTGSINYELIKKTFHILVELHESLRTILVSHPQSTTQEVLNQVDIPFFIGEIQEHDLSKMLADLSLRQHDLSSAPLFQIHLLRLSPDKHVLMLNLHHIIADGWSIEILNRQLSSIYSNLVNNEPPEPQTSELTYTDFVTWQANQGLSGETTSTKKYWGNVLHNITTKCLPFGRYRYLNNQPQASFSKNIFRFPKDLSQQLREYCSTENITPFVALIAGFNILLSKHCEKNDICILFDHANRARHEFSDIVGCFANTLVLRTTLEPAWTWRNLTQRTHQTVLSAIEHQHISFDNLMKIVDPHHSDGDKPPIAVAFSYQHKKDKLMKLPGVSVSNIPIDNVSSIMDISMVITESCNGLSGEFIYNSGRFNNESAERLCEQYVALLRTLLSCPDSIL